MTRIWKIAQGTDSAHCNQNGISAAIRMNMKFARQRRLPNNRKDSDSGLASRENQFQRQVDRQQRLAERMKRQFAQEEPPNPFILMP